MKHKGTVKLETERLILRRFTLDDAELMFANWANDPEVTEYLTWQPHGNIEVTKAVLNDWVGQYANDNFYLWAIVPKALGEPIGSISDVHQKDHVKELVHIGYCIGKKWWRQGYTSEALAELMRFFFEEVGANRVESRYDPRNSNSGAVMAKCGLKREGHMKQADRNNKGICDCVMYGLTAEDYAGIHNSAVEAVTG